MLSDYELISILNNQPENEICIMGHKIPLRAMPYLWEKQLQNLLVNALKNEYRSEPKEIVSINTLFQNNIHNSNLIKKIPEIIQIIAECYGLKYPASEIYKKEQTYQMLKVVVAQLNKNENSKNAAISYLLSRQKDYTNESEKNSTSELFDSESESITEFRMIEQLCERYSKLPYEITKTYTYGQILLLILAININLASQNAFTGLKQINKDSINSEVEQLKALEKMGFLAIGTTSDILAKKK